MRKILAIDFSIFGNKYLRSFYNINESDYFIRDYDYNLPFDDILYETIFGSWFFDFIKSISPENLHFLFHQEDIVSFLDEDCDIYNISFFDSSEDFTFLLTNKNWVKYAAEVLKVKQYSWICSNNSIVSPRTFNPSINIEDLDLNILKECDEVFISLCPNSIHFKHHFLFYNLITYCSTLNNYEYKVYEDYNNKLVYLDYYNWPQNKVNEKYCYTTLLGNDIYLNGVIGLDYSLKYSANKYPLIVLVSEKVSKNCINILESLGIKYKIIPDINLNENFNAQLNIIDATTVCNKVYTFSLDEYEKVLFIDADCIVTNYIDYLFNENDEDMCGSITKYQNNPSYACNLFMCKPNKQIFNDLLNKVNQVDPFLYAPDAKVFSEYFEVKPIKEFKNDIYHENRRCKYWIDKDLEDVGRYVKLFIDNRERDFHPLIINGFENTEITWDYNLEEEENQ